MKPWSISSTGFGLAVALILLGLAVSAQAGGGPPGVDVRAIAIDPLSPGILYAATFNQGVFRSDNGGTSWTPARNGMGVAFSSAFLNLTSLAIDPVNPDILYAGSQGLVFTTTNGGMSWSRNCCSLMPFGFSSDLSGVILALAIDPANPGTVYAGTGGFGVFKSTDGGFRWNAGNTGLTNTEVRALAIGSTNPATIYAGTSDGVFRSTDGATSWTAVNSGLTNTSVRALTINPSNPATLYAGTDGGVFKSTDGGASWTAANSGLTNMQVRALTINPGTPRDSVCRNR
jgi:photosystem II stability/assembly factor-like uncharacterized protein